MELPRARARERNEIRSKVVQDSAEGLVGEMRIPSTRCSLLLNSLAFTIGMVHMPCQAEWSAKRGGCAVSTDCQMRRCLIYEQKCMSKYKVAGYHYRHSPDSQTPSNPPTEPKAPSANIYFLQASAASADISSSSSPFSAASPSPSSAPHPLPIQPKMTSRALGTISA